MIFYFSATGNSQYVAAKIAAATGELCHSITGALQAGRLHYTLQKGEALGFVTPTYFWGLPSIVLDFLQRVSFTGKPAYTWHALTYGMTTGGAHRMMEKALATHCLPLAGRFAIPMVDTWTPMFDLTDTAQNQKTEQTAEPLIATVAAQVQTRTAGDHNKAKMPLAGVYYKTYASKRNTKSFTVSAACTGCGKCAQSCPSSAIQLQKGKPVWVKPQCTLCLGCLHRCPAFAIQYGKKTAAHGQYTHPEAAK